MSDQDEDDAHIFRWCEACRESHCVYCAQTDPAQPRRVDHEEHCEDGSVWLVYEDGSEEQVQEARDET
ncbi:MAG TPA: hypothetical protein VMW58_14465 [Anaerolineae bacterium]|nr:hypothetical protein [Anaerolineae bacterium]